MQCEEILSIFPGMLREALAELRVNTNNLQEIRIRAGRPVTVLCGNREYISGRVTDGAQVNEILAYLSSYSLYAYEDEIRQGFLSLPGGHRVGLSGRTVLESRKIKTITEISSLNIRFAHEIRGCADGLLPHLWENGRLLHTLIVSAPGRGKTTLLRDCIRQISNGSPYNGGMTVGVVDERSEIAGSFRGVPGNDVGMRTDVLDGCPKAEGMMMLIRSMSPKVIAVDEIGSSDELAALMTAMHCGCVLLATVHGSSMEELRKKPVLKDMMELKMFERYVVLDCGKKPGCVKMLLDRDGRETGRGGMIC
ncbi:MAG: stage III sporulation protein AA [Lachnospiraceae bacterium]